MKYLKYFLVSFFVFVFLCSATYLFPQPDYTKTPIFFVHGCGMYASSWDTMINDLQNSGYPSEFLRTIQLDPFCGPNIAAAEDQIVPAIETFITDVNNFLSTYYPQIPTKTKVDIISHSMGGLSTRWYCARVCPDRVNKWISIGCSNHGTDDLCKYGDLPNTGPGDCCPAYAANEQESYIQYQLNGEPYVPDVDETPYGIGTDTSGVFRIPPDGCRRIFYVTIRTVNDIWVTPDDSAIVDGAGGVSIPIPGDLPATETTAGNIRMDNGVGHTAMLSDFQTLRLLKIILNLDFAMSGPEINVSGYGRDFEYESINNGGTKSVDFVVGRHFIFMIENNGDDTLNLTGLPHKVTLSGPNAAHFKVIQQPSSHVAPCGSTPFTLKTVRDTVPPLPVGWERSISFVVNIPNDDSDENPYTFTITLTVKKY